MVYQLETMIGRRTLLKGAGLVTLCSLVASQASVAQSRSSGSILNDAELVKGLECPNCNSIQIPKNDDSRIHDNHHCQTCGVSFQ